MLVIPKQTSIFKEGESLIEFLHAHLEPLADASIIVIASKVVALSQARVVHEWDAQTKDALIKKSSDVVLHSSVVPLTLTQGVFMAAAGIDESNAQGTLILTPRDAYGVADEIRRVMLKKYNLRKLGVLIIDSTPMPLRKGVTAITLGYAGFDGIFSYKGKKDLFGRRFKYSEASHADMLAAAAMLVMGEGSEQKPLAVITEAPVKFSTKRVNPKSLRMNPRDDIYSSLYPKQLFKKKAST
ncbi:MAG: hypothetical protein RI911_723 [Candidatus Parcubacteria bacterium]|jgi:F420-0:gamma-glutamyl ligase